MRAKPHYFCYHHQQSVISTVAAKQEHTAHDAILLTTTAALQNAGSHPFLLLRAVSFSFFNNFHWHLDFCHNGATPPGGAEWSQRYEHAQVALRCS